MGSLLICRFHQHLKTAIENKSEEPLAAQCTRKEKSTHQVMTHSSSLAHRDSVEPVSDHEQETDFTSLFS